MKPVKRFETAYSSCLVAEDDQGPLVLYDDLIKRENEFTETIRFLSNENTTLKVKLKSLAIQSDIMIDALKLELKSQMALTKG